MVSLESIRPEFPTLKHWRHFDSARKAPLPRVALDAIASFLKDTQESGGAQAYSEETVERSRASIARLTGASPDCIAFTSNASEGINYVACGLEWRRGDNVVISSLEHPANVLPWRRLSKQGVELRVAGTQGNDQINVNELLSLMDDRTRVVSTSWVSYSHGHRLDPAPLVEACADSESLLVIDGIQGLGILDQTLPAIGADVFVTGAHKGLFGLPGTGFAYLTERAQSMVEPVFVGRHSYDSEDAWAPSLRPSVGARRFEYGNRNYLGVSVMGATTSWLDQIGLDAIENKIRRLTEVAIEQAVQRGLTVVTPSQWSQRASIIALSIERAPELREHLRTLGFLVSTKSSDLLRVSAQCFNTEEETIELVSAIADYCDRTRPHAPRGQS